jgi:hypothetical protein
MRRCYRNMLRVGTVNGRGDERGNGTMMRGMGVGYRVCWETSYGFGFIFIFIFYFFT